MNRKSSVKVMCPRCRDVYVGYNDRIYVIE